MMPPRGRRRLLQALTLGPGLLAGAHLAALLLFLNPGLGFRLGLFLRGVLTYGAALGLVGAVLLLPSWRRSPRRTLRALPWLISLVLAAAALAAGYHASRFAFYLPAGINVRLIKAALWLGLFALACFYTALLHSLTGRRYGPRSRALVVLLAVASLVVVAERRDAYRPATPPGALPVVAASRSPGSLVVVAIDSATLDVVLPLAEQGRLPFFGELLREGCYSRLDTLAPARPLAAWATLATGKLPYRHRILDDRVYRAPWLLPDGVLRLLPGGGPGWVVGVANGPPIGREDVDALLLWEILPRLGLRAASLGWPFGPQPGREAPATAPLPEEIPPRWAAVAAPALARDAARWQAAAAEEELDVLFLRVPGLAEVSRATFGAHVSLVLDGRLEERFQEPAETLAVYYRALDAELAALWYGRRAPQTLIVVSPFGTRAGRTAWDPRALLGRSGRGGRLGGEGLLLARGPGFRPGAFLADAALADVVPTTLYALGLPVAQDFDGRVLTHAFTPEWLARRPLTFVASYEGTIRPRRVAGAPPSRAPATPPTATRPSPSDPGTTPRPR